MLAHPYSTHNILFLKLQGFAHLISMPAIRPGQRVVASGDVRYVALVKLVGDARQISVI